MKSTLKVSAVFTLAALALVQPALAKRSSAEILQEHKRLAETTLLSYRANEVARYTTTRRMGDINPKIEALNQSTLADLKSLPIGRELDSRITTVDDRLADKILNSINRHPTVSSYQYAKYNLHPGVEIGFCFGRATYAHLMALHLGVLKDSIKKAWIVGPMNAGGNMWDFHVTTIVRSENGVWLAIDSNGASAIPVDEWYKEYAQYSTDGRIRLYITDANKFSVDLGKYDKIQMGLNLNKSQDWYSGYFQDMLTWFKQNDGNPDLTKLGLPTYQEIRLQKGLKPLTKEEQKMKDFISSAELAP